MKENVQAGNIPETPGISEYARTSYVSLIAKNGDIRYTALFYRDMYAQIQSGKSYVQAYNALGFDTKILSESRANCAGMRAVERAKNPKPFDNKIEDYDSDITFWEMMKKYESGEYDREDLYANMASRLIVMETMVDSQKKETKLIKPQNNPL